MNNKYLFKHLLISIVNRDGIASVTQRRHQAADNRADDIHGCNKQANTGSIIPEMMNNVARSLVKKQQITTYNI